jgi:FKBP-type peptidyl-prolyl cis-trans isomerase
MPPTANGQNTSENKPAQRVYRPGQRQQERIQRLTRRRKRRRIITATITAVLLIALGIAGLVWWQNDTAQRIALANAHATATATVVDAHTTATAIVRANATATVLTQNCFIDPSGPKIPPIYAGTATPSAGPNNSPALSGTPVELKGGLKYVDITVGTGPDATSGSNLSVEYTGWIASTCAKFDSSYGGSNAGAPFTLTLGKGQVIPGWDQGLVGVKAGGIRRLYIPAALAYGSQAQGPIPANSDLIFDVTVLSVK